MFNCDPDGTWYLCREIMVFECGNQRDDTFGNLATNLFDFSSFVEAGFGKSVDASGDPLEESFITHATQVNPRDLVLIEITWPQHTLFADSFQNLLFLGFGHRFAFVTFCRQLYTSADIT